MFELINKLKEFTVEVSRVRVWRGQKEVYACSCKYYSWQIPHSVPAGWFLGVFTDQII